MGRASHGVSDGCWYYELDVLEPAGGDKNAHVRFGWATCRADLHGPVGYDQFGFAYRDIQVLFKIPSVHWCCCNGMY